MSSTARILVVDDEPVIAMTLGLIFNSQGFQAKSFIDPREALAAARLEAPDLLISDVKMPHMSGVDLALLVKEACPDCRVVLVSGFANTVNVLSDPRLQGRDFVLLQKPVSPKTLLAIATEHSIPVESLLPRCPKVCVR